MSRRRPVRRSFAPCARRDFFVALRALDGVRTRLSLSLKTYSPSPAMTWSWGTTPQCHSQRRQESFNRERSASRRPPVSGSALFDGLKQALGRGSVLLGRGFVVGCDAVGSRGHGVLKL